MTSRLVNSGCAVACGQAILFFVLLPALSEVSAVRVAVNSWYVKFKKPTSISEAQEIARRRGFVCFGQLSGSEEEYHFVHRAVPSALTRVSVDHTQYLRREPSVAEALQQIARPREKRGYRLPRQRWRGSRLSRSLSAASHSNDHAVPSDHLFALEWHLRNTGQFGGIVGLDLNVAAAWAQGFTGRNVTVAILDDGIDYLHPDLWDNFYQDVSYDYSSNDLFPYPRYTENGYNNHGTRCAGEIAAARNGKQTVGVAYNSRIAGLRILDQPYMTDVIESKALGHMQADIDIYSASWGPSDNGDTVDGPRELTQRAMAQGINEGRQKKGNIYVWASGDGGPFDNCNCDGYSVSMWTISINSVTSSGEHAAYAESCSSTLASAFSNNGGGNDDFGVVTVDLYGETTLQHSGTSAAAPQAAGVFALVLEANPNVTWRDLQHLVVLTSSKTHLQDPRGIHLWKTNGAGFEFNHLFGFGVLDAGNIVDLAQVWRTVPDRHHCTVVANITNRNFTSGSPLRVTVDTDICLDDTGGGRVDFLEHVQAVISIKAHRRGDILLALISPMNTRSALLTRRPRDADNTEGFNKWPFMTTHCWGESAKGRWTLEASLEIGEHTDGGGGGYLSEFSLVLHGTRESPYLSQPGGKRHAKLATVRRRHASPRFRNGLSRKRLRAAATGA